MAVPIEISENADTLGVLVAGALPEDLDAGVRERLAPLLEAGELRGDRAEAVLVHGSPRIVAGEQNPTSAYMTGKLKIKGDMGAAMKLQKLF